MSDNVVTSWTVVLAGRESAGTLHLLQAEAGLHWEWADKPSHLVPLVGVRDPSSPLGFRPNRFAESGQAVFHVLDCIGFAFRGQCSLIEVSQVGLH